MKPELSIITVNYNGYDDTCEMIDSLNDHLTGIAYEAVIVDNASRNDEAARLRERYREKDNLKVVMSDRNLGFAGGNNLGIMASDGEYIMFINNDTYVEDDSIKYLLERLKGDGSIGIVSPKIRFTDEGRHIQFAGYTPLSRITLRNDLIGFDREDDGSFDTSIKSPYAHGAAMMFPRKILKRAGMMTEKYFLYYEELDWSMAVRRAGYTIVYEPRCTVFHKESRTTGRNSPMRTMYLTRNRLLLAHRNLRGIYRPLSVAYQLLGVAPVKSLVCRLKGDKDTASAIVKGCRQYIEMKDKND